MTYVVPCCHLEAPNILLTELRHKHGISSALMRGYGREYARIAYNQGEIPCIWTHNADTRDQATGLHCEQMGW